MTQKKEKTKKVIPEETQDDTKESRSKPRGKEGATTGKKGGKKADKRYAAKDNNDEAKKLLYGAYADPNFRPNTNSLDCTRVPNPRRMFQS